MKKVTKLIDNSSDEYKLGNVLRELIQDKSYSQISIATGYWDLPGMDVIEILTDQPTHQGARNYWKVLKNRLLKEGNETVTNCNGLKLLAEDGKMRMTDRNIQFVSTPHRLKFVTA